MIDVYSKFNQFIKDYFFNEATVGDSIVMAVDYTLIERFCLINNISLERFHKTITQRLRIDWYTYTNSRQASPYSIGLIAIQIYVASLMHNDEDFTANNYNSRLLEYFDLDITNNQIIQKLYKDYQDEIWQNLKKWTINEHYQVLIPKVGYGKGRYTQYPLSQSLLNQEDLNKVTQLFQKIGLKPNETISYYDFKNLFSGSDYGNNVTTHYTRTKNKLVIERKEELIFIQLFSFYNRWDGIVLNSSKRKKTNNSLLNKNKTTLVLDSYVSNVEVLDENNNVLKEIELNKSNFFRQLDSHYNLYNKTGNYNGIIVLVKDDSYNEWHDSRYLEVNKSCIIIMEHSNDMKSYIKRLDPKINNHSNSHIAIFEINVSKEQFSKSLIWQDLFSKQVKPYTVEGGLKLSRKVWMLDAGPIIKFTVKTDAWINGNIIKLENDNLTYSLVNAKEGTYILKVKNQAPTTIVIENPYQKENKIIGGWQINKENSTYKHSSDDYNINGLNVSFNEENTSDYNTRLWINDVIKKTKEETNPISILSQALKRKNHGI